MYYPQIVGADYGAASRAQSAAQAGASMALARVAEARERAAQLAQRGMAQQAAATLAALRSNPSAAANLALTRADIADAQMGLAPIDERIAQMSVPAAYQPAPAPVPLGGGQVLQQTQWTVARETLPIPRTLVPAGTQQTIIMTPQRPQRIERLVVGSSIGAYFQILDLECAKESQFTGSGGVPGEMFSEVAVDVSLKGATATPGVQITIQVENLDGNDHYFTGGIIGTALT